MRRKAAKPTEARAWVQILDQTVDWRFANLFRIVRARLQFRRFNGEMSQPITRINFERGDSVGVLLYDPGERTVVLVRQFRYPVYASLDPGERQGEGARRAWLLEIVAGVLDEGHTVTEVADKELLEEAGYEVTGQLQPITTIYPSPGGTSERIHLFWGEVDHRERAGEGGGVAAEGEDIEIVALPLQEALDMVESGEIVDGKTIVALLYLALRQAKQAA